MHSYKIALFVIATFIASLAQGQLVTDNTIPPAQLVQNTLIGSGVTVTNVTYTGFSGAIGYFNSVNANVGLDEGIILTTGTAADSSGGFAGNPLGPHGPNLQTGAGFDNGAPGDPQLAALAPPGPFGPAVSQNAAILEFDFIPTGDSVKFRYVFGSEEYPEFAPPNGNVNDVFGFFISGPGIVGQQNIALIPGTNLPVLIANVNAVTNNQFYVNNPMNNQNTVVQYDALTTVFTARAEVIPCMTYHLKIAISDIQDGILDSGVFLEANSLSSPALQVSTEVDFGGNDTTLFEGCGAATINLERTINLMGSDTVYLSYAGTATNGVDYNTQPDTLIFTPGVDSLALVIDAFLDATAEGIENIEITAITNRACINDTVIINLFIDDVQPLSITTSTDTFLTCSDSVPLWVSVSGGYGRYTYSWSSGIPANDTMGLVSPTVTTNYTVTVNDTCMGQILSDMITVTVPQPAPLTLALTPPDTTVLCPEIPVNVLGTAAGGTAPYTWLWDNGDLDSLTTLVFPTTDTAYLTVTDTCGLTTTDSIIVTVAYDTVSVQTSLDTSICLDDFASLSAMAVDGLAPFTYTWSTAQTGENVMVNPTSTNTYTVTVTDFCDIDASNQVTVNVQSVDADFTISANSFESNFPIDFTDASTGNVVSWMWDFGNGNFGNTQDGTSSYIIDGSYDVTLIATDDIGCLDSVTHTVVIVPEIRFWLPNAFTPNGDGINDYFGGAGVGILEYSMIIYDRWGGQVFETKSLATQWDGQIGGKAAPVGVYVYKYTIKDFSGVSTTKIGHLTLTK